jgi:DMSO/TMAO reductase YedYZ molybdopterin-dependent catalytic subunit
VHRQGEPIRIVSHLGVHRVGEQARPVHAGAEPVSPEPGAPLRVVVDKLERWRGTKKNPVEIGVIEEYIATASRLYHRAPVSCDPWQAATPSWHGLPTCRGI